MCHIHIGQDIFNPMYKYSCQYTSLCSTCFLRIWHKLRSSHFNSVLWHWIYCTFEEINPLGSNHNKPIYLLVDGASRQWLFFFYGSTFIHLTGYFYLLKKILPMWRTTSKTTFHMTGWEILKFLHKIEDQNICLQSWTSLNI